MNDLIKYWDNELVISHIGTELNWLLSYLDTNKIERVSFIDIGGNVGKFFDELSKKYIIEKCIIVEPSKVLYNHMVEKFSGSPNVEIFNFAISDENGKFNFTDSAEQSISFFEKNNNSDGINLGLSKLSKFSGDTLCYSMEYFLENFNTIPLDNLSFIKIDTENMDLNIIKSMTNFFHRNNMNPFILFENNYHNDMKTEDAIKIMNDFCTLCGYEMVDLSNPGDNFIKPIKKNKMVNVFKDVFKLSYNFKIDKKFWDHNNLSGDEHDKQRSKPAPYIKTTINIAKKLNLKTVVEIGSTRHATSRKCIDYFYSNNDAYLSPPCCNDGHSTFFFTNEGFEVFSVDIDENCKTQNIWSFQNLRKEIPSNLHLEIPKDGIEFLSEFQSNIDILYLDGWDVGTPDYALRHLEAYMSAKNKLSKVHLILIDDTDFITEDGGKDAMLSPYLIDNGYIPLFNGRQTLFINTINEEIEEIEIKDNFDYRIEDTPLVVLSMSTTPSRLNEIREGWGVKPVIDQLINLTYPNYEIHFNIPYINHKTQEEYIIPEWLIEYEKTNQKLKIFRCNDYGSITKIVPTLMRIDDPDSIIITVDDDLNYNDGFIEYHLKKRQTYPNSVLGFAGISAIDGSCHFCTTLNKDTRVKIIEGYKTVSYLRKFFKEDFFNDFVGQSWSDDILLSAYLGKENIEKIVMNYNLDTVFNPVVESFPVISSIPNDKSGCSLYREQSVSDNSEKYYKLGFLEK